MPDPPIVAWSLESICYIDTLMVMNRKHFCHDPCLIQMICLASLLFIFWENGADSSEVAVDDDNKFCLLAADGLSLIFSRSGSKVLNWMIKFL